MLQKVEQPSLTYLCNNTLLAQLISVEARYNEGPRDWHNLFATTDEVSLYIFYYYWGRESRSLYRELCFIEVRYIEVALQRTTRAELLG